MIPPNTKFRNLWQRVFQHSECLCDVYLLDGTVFYGITKERWGDLNFGHIRYYREVEDDRFLGKARFYSPSHIIDKVVFLCSSCRKEKDCEKYFRSQNRRVEG